MKHLQQSVNANRHSARDQRSPALNGIPRQVGNLGPKMMVVSQSKMLTVRAAGIVPVGVLLAATCYADATAYYNTSRTARSPLPASLAKGYHELANEQETLFHLPKTAIRQWECRDTNLLIDRLWAKLRSMTVITSCLEG